MVEQKIIEDFVEQIKPDIKETNKTHSAIVSKIDEEGTVWVRVAGSDKDTPTTLVGAEVKKGDAVNVEWRNNKLYIASNYSNPSAGVVRVEAVEQAAQLANAAANNAVLDAGRAKEAADSASASAEQAQKDAGSAKESAESAGEYAARALGNLSTVQSVTETLNWITQHGTMTLTTDTALDPTHVYFVQDNNGDYVVGNVHYSVVTEPKLADISTYYELSINESLNNYVATHLALTDEGLYIMEDGSKWKVKIADDGVYILDQNNKPTNQMTNEGNIVGYEEKSRLHIKPTGIRAYNEQNLPFFRVDALDGIDTIEVPFDISVNNRESEYVYRLDTQTDFYSPETSAFDISNCYLEIVRWDSRPIKVAEAVENCSIERVSESCVRIHPTATSISDGLIVCRANLSYRDSEDTLYEEKFRIGAYFYENTQSKRLELWWVASESSYVDATYTICGVGKNIYTSANPAFVFGTDTGKQGPFSTEIGFAVSAGGAFSHAQNQGTIAAKDNQTAIGKWNLEDVEETESLQKAFIIGNGQSVTSRSNGFTVDWDGNTEMQGRATTADMTTEEITAFINELRGVTS